MRPLLDGSCLDLVAAGRCFISAQQPPVQRVRRQSSPGLAPIAGPSRELLDKYCVGCHNQRLKTGGLRLEGDQSGARPSIRTSGRRWSASCADGAMPPGGHAAPEPRRRRRARDPARAIARPSRGVDPKPGVPMLHRLNRAEYANAIRDLLASTWTSPTLLPPDDRPTASTTSPTCCGVSPSLHGALSRRGARRSARWRSAIRASGRASDTYRVRQDSRRTGTSRAAARHASAASAPATRFRSTASTRSRPSCYAPTWRRCAASRSARGRVRDRRRAPVHRCDDRRRRRPAAADPEADRSRGRRVDARLRVRVPSRPGPRVDRRHVRRQTRRRRDTSGCSRSCATARPTPLDLDGPAARRSRSRSPGRSTRPAPATRRAAGAIFVCRPASAADGERRARATILSTLARRAYRRPVTDADLDSRC